MRKRLARSINLSRSFASLSSPPVAAAGPSDEDNDGPSGTLDNDGVLTTVGTSDDGVEALLGVLPFGCFDGAVSTTTVFSRFCLSVVTVTEVE